MTTKKKIYFSILSLAILSVLIVTFAVFPMIGGIQDSSQELISQKEKLASLNMKSTSLKEVKILYNDFQPEVDKSDNLFVDNKMPVAFIGFLEKTAKDSNVKAKIFPLSSRREKEDPWPSLGFQVESSGSFSNFMKFLEKIESAPYLIEVLDLNMARNSQAKESTDNSIQVIFSIKVYTN